MKKNKPHAQNIILSKTKVIKVNISMMSRHNSNKNMKIEVFE
jgi:hypothetical protein